MIEDAKEKNISFSDIVFDSWYFSKETVDFIQENFLTFITECDADRLISYGGKWVHADELVKLIPVSKFRYKVTAPNFRGEERKFLVYSFCSKIRGLKGSFLIVVTWGWWEEKDTKKFHVYVTNHCSLSPEEVIRRYALRWGIEQICRDLKENVGFDQYQTRTIKAINRHWHLAALAYTFLVWSRFNGTFSKIFHCKPKTCGEQLKLFRNINSICVLEILKKDIEFYGCKRQPWFQRNHQSSIKHHFSFSSIS